MQDSGILKERFVVVNYDESWLDFIRKYKADEVEIALEASES